LAKAVRPAEIIPVIYVKGEGNDLIGLDALFGKRAYPVIYWGATASTLGGIEFQQSHRMRRTLHGARLRVIGLSEEWRT
jgi:hypothetical protein